MGATSNINPAPVSVNGKGGFQGPDTRAPGGGGMDYEGNPIGGGMGAQFNFGGPPSGAQIGFGPANPQTPGGQELGAGAQTMLNSMNDLLIRPGLFSGNGQQPMPTSGMGGGRFQPNGLIPPAGARPQVRGSAPNPRRLGRYNPQPVFGNPRQFNPGQGPMQPGMPAQPPGLIDPGYGVTPKFGGGKGGFQGPFNTLL